jgi:pyridoxamine 5'-phosphate oxidase
MYLILLGGVMVFNWANIRRDYVKQHLSPKTCLADPIQQLEKWLQDAINAKVVDPTAMTIATVNAQHHPTSRVVLLKGIEKGSLVWFTNYQSNKGQAIAHNPYVAVVFFWPEMERQIRIEGLAQKIADAASDAYFASRPYQNQLGAWASNQSQIIASKVTLLKKVALYGMRYPLRIPRPPYWGGYELIPTKIEFWQGRPSRLHDRICYNLQQEGVWQKVRLAP